MENRTKNEEKWTEPKGSVKYPKTDEHIHWEFKKEKKNVKEILMKFMNIHLQEAQTPVRKTEIYSKIHYNQTLKRQRENLQNTKRNSTQTKDY